MPKHGPLRGKGCDVSESGRGHLGSAGPAWCIRIRQRAGRTEGPWREDLCAEAVGGSVGRGVPGEWTGQPVHEPVRGGERPSIGGPDGPRRTRGGAKRCTQFVIIGTLSDEVPPKERSR